MLSYLYLPNLMKFQVFKKIKFYFADVLKLSCWPFIAFIAKNGTLLYNKGRVQFHIPNIQHKK